MFTGIVETTAEILSRSSEGITVRRPAFFDDIEQGNSIAVAGTCLSVVQFDDESLTFDVIGETWRNTNLGDRKAGDRVNVERSVRVNGRLEGHIVQGHIEGTGLVTHITPDDQWTRITLQIPAPLRSAVVHKGAIALDGVSLTVASVTEDTCDIALIPHTLSVTTFGGIQIGDRVNIETDILARYCYALLSPQSR